METRLLLLAWLGASGYAQTAIFTPTGNLTVARAFHAAALLPNGKVLIAGGGSATLELYDPSTGTFTATGAMTASNYVGSATMLLDGRVLLTEDKSAELYDPSTGNLSATGSMLDQQAGYTATLLSNGKVLITGGVIANVGVASPELYDPSTGGFTLASPYASVYPADDFGSTATLLGNGNVLFAADPLYTPDYGAELYDAATNTFRPTGTMVSNINGRTATLLMNGNVLLAGGETEDARYQKAELYDPAAGKFTATGDMTMPRNAHAAVLLPDGAVLITGGEGWGPIGNSACCYFLGSLASAELYDSSTGTFTAANGMTARREWHAATLLNDGRVLITGGIYYGGIGIFYGSLASAEVYTPLVLVPAPALFSISGDGKGQGAIWHAQTGQIASSGNPAVAGEALSMYTTSLGDDGMIPPQVSIGGRLAPVLYFGAAPGYPGYHQVNFLVPDGISPGPAVSVRLMYIGRSSNAVTIGVR
jgi:hypothetical protein